MTWKDVAQYGGAVSPLLLPSNQPDVRLTFIVRIKFPSNDSIWALHKTDMNRIVTGSHYFWIIFYHLSSAHSQWLQRALHKAEIVLRPNQHLLNSDAMNEITIQPNALYSQFIDNACVTCCVSTIVSFFVCSFISIVSPSWYTIVEMAKPWLRVWDEDDDAAHTQLGSMFRCCVSDICHFLHRITSLLSYVINIRRIPLHKSYKRHVLYKVCITNVL